MVPPQLGDLTSLTDLDLSSNRLTGPIPSELGSLALLTQLNLSHNGLTGEPPEELGNLVHLSDTVGLGLGYNHLTIPAGYPDLSNPFHIFLQQKAGSWETTQTEPPNYPLFLPLVVR